MPQVDLSSPQFTYSPHQDRCRCQASLHLPNRQRDGGLEAPSRIWELLGGGSAPHRITAMTHTHPLTSPGTHGSPECLEAP